MEVLIDVGACILLLGIGGSFLIAVLQRGVVGAVRFFVAGLVGLAAWCVLFPLVLVVSIFSLGNPEGAKKASDNLIAFSTAIFNSIAGTNY